LSARSGDGKEILVGLGWGDQIAHAAALGEAPLLTAEGFQKPLRDYKAAGADVVLFRLDVLRWVRDYNWPEPNVYFKDTPKTEEEKLHLDMEQKQWAGSHQAMEHNMIQPVVELAHQAGLRIYAHSTVFDEGMPLNEIWYAPGERGKWNVRESRPWQFTSTWHSSMISKFTEAHPEYVMVDRSQKKHNWGTLEFAYAQARDYVVGYNRWLLESYPFDGIYIDFRNEFSHPEFGDQFGFAPPIVEEYQKRYGVNILREQFDLEKWRRLCGEYLTQFIRELYAMVHGKGKTLVVGIAQGNYMGLPNGNMYVDWQGWVKEHILDGLVIGPVSGQFIFPDRIGYGYLTDQEEGIGLPNILWDLQNNYWPHCARYGVKLYAEPGARGFKQIPLAEFTRMPVDGLSVSRYSLGALNKLQ
jgi:hypothetical protein